MGEAGRPEIPLITPPINIPRDRADFISRPGDSSLSLSPPAAAVPPGALFTRSGAAARDIWIGLECGRNAAWRRDIPRRGIFQGTGFLREPGSALGEAARRGGMEFRREWERGSSGCCRGVPACLEAAGRKVAGKRRAGSKIGLHAVFGCFRALKANLNVVSGKLCRGSLRCLEGSRVSRSTVSFWQFRE